MQNKLPADPSALILGIIGLVLGVAGCCCYGFTALIPLVLSIVGLVSANKSMQLYNANPSEFSESSRSNVSLGRILCIISIIMNSLFLLIVIGAITIIGIAGFQGAFDSFKNKAYESENVWEYQQEATTIEYPDLEEIDSVSTDSVFLEEVFPKLDTLN